MYQNYNYYPQQPQPQQPYLRQAPAQISLRGRPVSSFEEAKASPIDFDGSISYFPDLGNKRIYTKQINPDGTATLCMYELKELPNENINAGIASMDRFVGRDEFEQAIAQLRKELAPAPPKKTEVMSF